MTQGFRNKSKFDSLDEAINKEERLDSMLGYSAVDVDLFFASYETSQFLLIEKKNPNETIGTAQLLNIQSLDKVCRTAADGPTYCGYHLIRANLADISSGEIYLDDKLIDWETLVAFLSFKKPHDWYKTYSKFVDA